MITRSYVLEDEADAHVEVVDGLWFLHVNVFHNVPSVYKWLRECFDEVEKLAKENGQHALFALTPSPEFCDVIYPTDDVEHMDGDFYLVTWGL